MTLLLFSLLTRVTEFAFEIGSSLLAELRRLQTVVTEDEKAIQDFKRAIEELTIALRRQESNAGESFRYVSRSPRLDQLSRANKFEYHGESWSSYTHVILTRRSLIKRACGSVIQFADKHRSLWE